MLLAELNKSSYAKITSLNYLRDSGFNVHKYVIVDSIATLKTVLYEFDYYCTVRTDSEFESESLPFYVVTAFTVADVFEQIVRDRRSDYKYIVSVGIRYDTVQSFNLVAKFDKKGDFFCEASMDRVPLRNMYKYPNSLFSASGNVSSEISEWDVIRPIVGFDKQLLKRVLLELYGREIWDVWFETTVYPERVGLQNEYIVYWQLLKEKKKIFTKGVV